MGFTSTLYPGEKVYDDSTDFEALAHDTGKHGRGLVLPINHNPQGRNYSFASAFPPELLIPKSDVEAWCKEKEERKSRISDELIRQNIPCKDQASTNYCWINAPTHCLEILRVIQNQPYVELSPASVGCKIKNFQNQGGWGEEGLRYIVEHGVVPVSLWPANAIARQYDKPESWTEADKYRVTEWMELTPRNAQQQWSCYLRNIPTGDGQNHWSHEVTGCDVVILDGEICFRKRNSWGMGWSGGTAGFFVQRGSKMLADDCVAPRVAVAA